MKGKTSFQYQYWESSYGKQGIDAMNLFFLRGNYVSGIIYNRSIITNEFIDNLYETFDNTDNIAFEYYPHLFIDAYALFKGAFAASGITLIREGEPEEQGNDDENKLVSYRYPDSRIQQGIGYIPLLNYLDIEDKIKVIMFCKVYQKTIFLLNLSKDKYLEAGLNWDEIIKKAVESFREIFSQVDIEDSELYREIVIDYLSIEKM